MSDELGRLWVVIGAKTDEFREAIGQLNKDLGKAEKDFKKSFGNIAREAKEVGKGMTVAGAAITATMGMMIKSAADEDVGIQRLAKSMENVGLAYDGANGALEKWINNQMLSTGFGDGEQRDALSNLIVLTKDQTKAQELLTTAMDLAAWKGMDLATASNIIGKVYSGNTEILKRYGIVLDVAGSSTQKVTVDTEALAKAQKEAEMAHKKANIALQENAQSLAKAQPGSLQYQKLLLQREETENRVAEADAKVAEIQKGKIENDKQEISSTEALLAIREKSAGQAETYAKTTSGQWQILQNTIGDLSEDIGGALLPVITDLIKSITPMIQGLRDWISANPELTKTIVIVVAAIGGILTILGPLLMMLPGIIAAIPLMGAAFAALTGPVGLVVAAIAAVIAIGAVLIANWESISTACSQVWQGICDFLSTIWETIVNVVKDHWQAILGILFPPIGLVELVIQNWDKIVATVKGIFGRVADAIKAPIEAACAWVADQVNWIISKVNEVTGLGVGSIGGSSGAISITPVPSNNVVSITPLASGGIVTRPTMSLIGESGPEAVVPLNKGLGNTINIQQMVVREEADINRIARELYRMQTMRGAYG